MKKFIFTLLILAAFSIQASAGKMESLVIFVETGNGEILEMPVYMEEPVEETIPGSDIRLDTYHQTIDHNNLTRLLLCISKPETEEPFPFELN